MKIKEHIIVNKSDTLNLSQAKIILESLKDSEIAEQKKNIQLLR